LQPAVKGYTAESLVAEIFRPMSDRWRQLLDNAL